MDWKTFADLVIAVGLPAATQIVNNWINGVPVDAARLDELKALTMRDARNRMLAVLQANGIDPTSPQGVALLALVS